MLSYVIVTVNIKNKFQSYGNIPLTITTTLTIILTIYMYMSYLFGFVIKFVYNVLRSFCSKQVP